MQVCVLLVEHTPSGLQDSVPFFVSAIKDDGTVTFFSSSAPCISEGGLRQLMCVP